MERTSIAEFQGELRRERMQAGSPFPRMEGRIEDARLLMGRGRYIDDLAVGRHALHAAIIRSPHGHARILAIDARAALAVRGVVACYTAADLAAVMDRFPNIVRSAPEYRGMATDRVRYVGEPVAIVLASDRYVAEDGAQLVDVDYEPLEAVTEVDRAAAADAPLLHGVLDSNVVWRNSYRYGDPVGAFASADRIVSVDLVFPKYNSTPLETYGVVAEYLPESDGYVLHGNFQGPFSLLPVLARALRVPESRIRLIVPDDIGGSFGNKAMIYPYMGLMAACSRLAGRPVKWIEDRAEHLLASASGTARRTRIEAAVTRGGVVRAIRMDLREDVGAYLRAPEPSCVMRSLTTFSGPYRIESGEITAACVLTNTLPTGLNRGYGGQQYMFSLERLMDAVARETGIDRIEIRRRNFLRPEEFPYRTTTGSHYDSGDYEGCLNKALELIRKDGWEEIRDALRAKGRLAGIGIATCIHSAASNIGYVTLALSAEERGRPGYNAKSGSSDFAHVALDPSGKLRAHVGTAGAGQGHATAVAQIIARQFGIEPGEVEVVDRIDTQTTPWTITTGTYASRFSVVVGGAVHRAAIRLSGQLLQIAAHLLEANLHDVEFVEGRALVKGTNRSLSLKQIAGAVQWDRGSLPADLVQLQVSESYTAANLAAPDSEHRVNAASTYGFMADLALVEIDPVTYVPRVVKYAAVHDVGVAINPQLVRGQIAGGIVQGIAGALYEHLAYDESGQMLNGTFMDYLCPTASEAPAMLIDHHNTPSPFTQLGDKGCGENSATSAPAAVASAVEDALFRSGVIVAELPLTPASIWRSMEGRLP